MQGSHNPEETIAILDAGSQYGKVIDRRVRELKVKTELLPLSTPFEALSAYKAIIISGGPESVYSSTAPPYDPKIFTSKDHYLLGICYGHQLLNFALGGKVGKKGGFRQDGQSTVDLDASSPLFKDMDPQQKVLLTHGDVLDEEGLGTGLSVIGRSGGIAVAIQSEDKRMFGVQFHPEVDLTVNGKQIFSNFLFNVAGLTGVYTMEDRQAKAIDEIKEKVGEDKKVLMLVSGGVDSSVCAALVNKAIGPDRIYAIHIDHGLMRKNESSLVEKALSALGLRLKVVHAQDVFANSCLEGSSLPLKATVKPEDKRNIIGDTFMRVAEAEIKAFGLDPSQVILAQGTLRPDLIESASKIASKSVASVIKTHHNDTTLVRKLRDEGRVVEPLKDYHKDEVRELGKALGLSDALVWRQPFPGPGLAVRILCSEAPFLSESFDKINEVLKHLVNYKELVELVKDSSSKNIPEDVLSIPDRIHSCLAHPEEEEAVLLSIQGIHATLLPIQSVGVQGDGRTYSHVVGLSGTKNWAQLFFLAKLIPKLVHNVNRVVYIFGSPVEGPIKSITVTHMTSDVIEQLQEADDVVNQALYNHNLVKSLSQVPVISIPVHFEKEEGHRSIAIRTMITNDFMTGVAAVPGKELPEPVLEEMVDKILKVPGIARVVYDLTGKPPGTTEWE